jgi:hypothetical protein
VLDPPKSLPIESLSISSINLFSRCPEKWRRRYLENQYEPASGSMVLGSAVGAAAGSNYQEKIQTMVDQPLERVLDTYADEFELRKEQEEIDWGRDKPGTLKDSGTDVLTIYQEIVAPTTFPTAVERKFELSFPEVDWTFKGYIDLEDLGSVSDLKVRRARMNQNDADSDPQATAYLLARRAEGNPARSFNFHTMVRTKQPYTEQVPTARSDQQMDNFINRLYRVATEMVWRTENEAWQGAPPGAWWCSKTMCAWHGNGCAFV